MTPADPDIPQASHPTPAAPNLRARFTGGALESASHILGSTSASVFAAGLVAPFIAAIGAPRSMDGRMVLAVSALAAAFSMAAGLGAILLRGLAHCAPHGMGRRRSGEGDAR